MSLYRPLEAEPGTLRFKLFHLGRPVTLSDSQPMLKRMGLKVLDERPYRISPPDHAPVWLHDFGMQTRMADADVDIHALHAVFEDAFGRIFRGEVENDDFNRLVVAARMPAAEIVVLRAYAKYLRQIGFPLSQAFIESTLAANAGDRRRSRRAVQGALRSGSEGRAATARPRRACAPSRSALEAVDNLSEDRVLRQLLALILATTRTNFWRRDAEGRPRSFLSFKFDPAKVPGLPEPRPMFEIFVYSPRFEGVHMRGGRVARGGLRWSDRPEDFRTEILGLVKAQMVKNVVIVPVGSKGGFVLKRAPSPADRDAYLKEGIACYQDYLRALLDLTDNRVGDRIVPPPQVRRHDTDDPVSRRRGRQGHGEFFRSTRTPSAANTASGSATRSHRGARRATTTRRWASRRAAPGSPSSGTSARWASTRRPPTSPSPASATCRATCSATACCSRRTSGSSRRSTTGTSSSIRTRIRRPRSASGERLFRLPRSSWADYDAKLLSAGGGIHARSAKSIAITGEVKAALAITADHADADRARQRDPEGAGRPPVQRRHRHLRQGHGRNARARSATARTTRCASTGRELRCKVLAEGGNLGCTQLGRVEFAQAGGRIYTDAIDNSAGVDTSDHEVNIKILLGLAVADGELTEKQRNALLAEMTDDVAALVLRDNYFQTQVLSVTGRIAPELLDAQQRFVQYLEKEGRLHRAIEYLPSDGEFARRRTSGQGLAAPEHAILLAYAKMWLFDELVASSLPDDPWVASVIARYFPRALAERYAAYMDRHPLKREIIATHVTNSMLNRVGSTFVHRLMETTGAGPHEVVRAYLLSREVFGFVALWKAIEALDNKVDDALQAAMLIDMSRELERGTTWFLRSRRLGEDMAATIAHFAPRVEALAAGLPALLDAPGRARIGAAVGGSCRQGAFRRRWPGAS